MNTSPFKGPLLAAMLAGCSFAPAYREPATPATPPGYREAGDWQPAQPGDAVPRGPWWNAYHDPELDAFEARIGEGNQDIKAALARLREARAQTRIARAGFLPAVNAAGYAERSRNSVNSPRYPVGENPLINDFDLEADVSYEFDLWGRVRNQVASAKAAQRASAADLASLDLSIRAELATDYFALRSADAQQVLLDKALEDYRRSLRLTQDLYNGGAAALTDVAQAQAQVEIARTQASDIRLQRAQTEHAIAVLLGENASTFHLPLDPLPMDVVPPPLDPGLPSALLERRPDIAAAERRVAAANAEIGVARAAYFPTFSLSPSIGLNSTRAANWLSAPSRFWSVGPAATLPLFEGGRLRAQTEQTKAAYDEQVANYRNTVLTAYQEVEDNLAALRQLQQETLSEAAAVKATGTALQQANYRYKGGLATYLEVATTENTALQTQLTAANIQLRWLSASVLLVKALGGGWQRPSGDGGD